MFFNQTRFFFNEYPKLSKNNLFLCRINKKTYLCTVQATETNKI